MARQGYRSRHPDPRSSAKTCDPTFLPCPLLYLNIIRKNKRTIGGLKYIATCTSSLFSVWVSSSLFFLQRRPICANSSNAALSFWPSRLVLSAASCCQSSFVEARSLIQQMQWSIRRSDFSGPAPCWMMMLMDWAISKMCSLTLLSLHCVVKPPYPAKSPWYVLPIGWLQRRHSWPRCGLEELAYGL